jgi:hypothetical protein
MKQRGGRRQEALLTRVEVTAICTLWLMSHFPNLSNSSTKSLFLTFLEMLPINKLISITLIDRSSLIIIYTILEI